MERRTKAIALSLAVCLVSLALVPGWADGPVSRTEGFERDGFTVNDNDTNAFSPAVAFGSLSGDPYDSQPLVAFEQVSNDPATDILVKSFSYTTGAWDRRGAGSLNLDRSHIGERPALALVGRVGAGVAPWVAFNEVRPDQMAVPRYFWDSQVFVRRLVQDGTGEHWSVVGQNRGAGGRLLPSLNMDLGQNAANAALAVGPAPDQGGERAVWVAWDEDTRSNRQRQVYVRRAAPSDAPAVLGGYRWDLVGQPRGPGGVPSLNVNPSRLAEHPTLAFAGQNGVESWVVWQESELPLANPRITDPTPIARLYSARAVPDASTGGGYRWETQPTCPTDAACALNRNFQNHAVNPRLTAGSLAGEDPNQPTPWVVWQETVYETRDINFVPIRYSHIFVSRWDGARWRAVGGPLNVALDTEATNPDIRFVDHVPYVAWSEEKGKVYDPRTRRYFRFAYVYVARLADATLGRERWELVTNVNCGANFVPYWAGDRPALADADGSVYLAWQESGLEIFPPADYNPRGQPVFAARLAADRPAGCNTALNTPTPFVTPTTRATRTASPTLPSTATANPPPLPTGTPTATPSSSPTSTRLATATPTLSATRTATPTVTTTPTLSPTSTLTFTPTVTPTFTPTWTATVTRSPSPSATATPTLLYRLYLPYINATRPR
ncbi:MAG: hypothetical protein KIT87_14555 [Anaerolineae bacterium]|nr:hypothetical protein [Anaerolineae bacterium]